MSDENREDPVDEVEAEEGEGSPEVYESLEYVLRGRSLGDRISDAFRATPWWIVSLALHAAAILVMTKVVYMTGISKPEEDVVVSTDIKTDEPKPIDLKQLEKVFQEVKKDMVREEPVVQAPTLIERERVRETTEVSEAVDVADTSDDLSADVGDVSAASGDDFMGVSDAQAGGGSGGYGVGTGGDETMSVGEGTFTARGMTTYKQVIDDVVTRITRSVPQKRHANVLLVWVMDASLSMKDDQAAIKERLWELDAKFREETSGGTLKQAVVYYGEKPRAWLDPTSDVDMVIKAVEAIESNPPGSQENGLTALSFVVEKYGREKGVKKVAVRVDDDSCDDTHLLEKALEDMKKSNFTLYEINRECPFQGIAYHEPFEWVDEKGVKYSGSGTVIRGPETAYAERTNVAWGWFFDPVRVMSGFGIYDVSRIAFYTGGAYYILGEAKADYDWDLMELYRPELVSRADYQARTAKNPFKSWIEKVQKEWNAGCPGWGWHYPWSALEQERDRCKTKLGQVDDFIRQMKQNAVMPTKKLEALKENRRWPGNADLTWVALILAKYRIRQYLYAIEEFRAATKSIPETHHVFVQHNQQPKATAESAKDKEEVVDAMRFLADRHPRTPWGLVVSQFNPDSSSYIYGLKLTHAYWFEPYCAILTMDSGMAYTCTVLDENKEKNTVRFSVPQKGERTVPRAQVRSIVKCPRNVSPGSWHPRI